MPYTPNGPVWYADGTTPYSAQQISAAEASNLDGLFALRERYDFTWLNASERNAQLNMVQGSRGYQNDTKTEYIFDNSTWRMAIGHMELTSSVVAPNSTVTQLGVMTVDTPNTTDSLMATPGATGVLNITYPGIYAVSTLSSMVTSPATGRTFLDLALGATTLMRTSIVVGEDAGSIAMPNLRLTAPNSLLNFKIFRTVTTDTGATNTRIRLTRIG